MKGACSFIHSEKGASPPHSSFCGGSVKVAQVGGSTAAPAAAPSVALTGASNRERCQFCPPKKDCTSDADVQSHEVLRLSGSCLGCDICSFVLL